MTTPCGGLSESTSKYTLLDELLLIKLILEIINFLSAGKGYSYMRCIASELARDNLSFPIWPVGQVGFFLKNVY